MAKHIISFPKNNNILYNLQFGFREKHSTVHAAFEILETISPNLDVKEYF